MNVGIGYDSHRLVAGRPLILGGTTIPSEVGCTGHSDADAVAHALTDAILGAANAGNIGTMFPDTDSRWKDADSIALLRSAYAAVQERGFRFRQADITIILEQPRLGPYVDTMATALARALDGGPDQISIKPKTNEGMGWIGRGEGVAVMAVATLDIP
ncbi:MAG: 2-C-methyl-D-erythritol 2,4-cyclodiphosphate synthase [Gemmatimonadales bacterium]